MSFEAMAWATRQEVPALQKLVLLMLSNRHNNDSGLCIPSHEKLAKECGMSKTAVKGAIKSLAEKGCLSIEQRFNGSAATSNQYNLNLEFVFKKAVADAVGRQTPHVVRRLMSSDDPCRQTPEAGRVTTEGGASDDGRVGRQTASKQEVETIIKTVREPVAAAQENLPAKKHKSAAKATEPGGDDSNESALQLACRETFKAYASAYWDRYGAEPVVNAKIRTQVKQFVQRVPYAEAPLIAANYLTNQSSYYVRKGHDVGSMLADAEKLRTEWATRRQVTDTQAHQLDRTQSNFGAAEEAIRILQAQGVMQ